MVYKRPFGDEESYELSFKHPRHLKHSNQLALFVESVPCNNVPLELHTSDVEGEVGKSQGEEKFINNEITELSVGADKDFETSVPGCLSSLSWVINSVNEEDSRSEIAVWASFSHNVFEPDCPTMTIVQPEEIYAPLSDYHPRKLVPVGPDHQADVPSWGLKGIVNASVDEDNGDKLMGTCIIPMPNSNVFVYNKDGVGHGFCDCSCPDDSSIRCVRQHIVEAREMLRKTLGQETFAELGFCDMGEEISGNWSEEEEEVFHEVVFSNLASSGRNFWDHLSVVFPSRTKKDIISYYFNVFMLRIRAEQNRLDPMNIDSDNDEWRSSNEGENEFGMTEEDEDSVVESPTNQNGSYIEECFHEDETYGSHDGSDGGVSGEEYNERIDNVSDRRVRKFLGDCSFDNEVQLESKNSQNGGEDHDIQDDSCMSYECQPNKTDSNGPVDAGAKTQESHVGSDHCQHFQCSYGGLSGVIDHDYVLELSDAKLWDVGYQNCPEKDLDFLSTCNMIEEVFGEEAWNWNSKGRDEKGGN